MFTYPSTYAVTGAFGYTGRYIATRLLDQGKQVITLTGHPDRPSPFGSQVTAYPFNFERPDRLSESLRGVHTLFNTYWVRFDRGQTSFEGAVRNTQTLFRAAKQAGVRRLVHISITNPSIDSSLPYFHGKAVLEDMLRTMGISYAILRPTVIFGREDILINNIVYLLRRFPIFAIPGDGRYRLQPVFVEDLAELAVQQSSSTDNITLDATGPEVFSFNELLDLLSDLLRKRTYLLHTPPPAAYFFSNLVGMLVRDVVLTRDELEGLMGDLLVTSSPPCCRTRFSGWAKQNIDHLGRGYASEIARHYQFTHANFSAKEGAIK